jgi:hypothetical protein
MLRMLLVWVGSYLKAALRYTFLILDSCHPDTQRLSEQGCEDLWSFFEDKRGSEDKNFWETLL